MQDADWEDLKVFLAVVEAGSFAGAARRLTLHETTVARRIGRLETYLGQTLVQRGGGGLTKAGQKLAAALPDIRAGLRAAELRLGQGAEIKGEVRLSAVPWIVDHVMVPEVMALRQAHPDLRLSLEASESPRDPAQGAIDLALRFARPQGRTGLVTRRLADVPFAVFGRSEAPGWIGYGGTGADLPQAGWVGAPVVLHVSSPVSAAAAVQAGLGRAHLPLGLGPPDLLLERGSWLREVWLLRHSALVGDPAVDCVVDWLAQSLAKRATGLAQRVSPGL